MRTASLQTTTGVGRSFPEGRPRMLVAGPYYWPNCYGGAVQVYHQLFSRLQSLEAVVVGQRQGADPVEMEAFDRTCLDLYGYEMKRIRRFDLLYEPDTNLLGRLMEMGKFYFGTQTEWRRTIREVQPDVIICGATITAGWLMSRIPGPVPYINYLHGEELGFTGGSRLVRPYLFRTQLEAIRKADLNISVSRYTAEKAARLAGIDSSRFVLLPNFVDLSRFGPPENRVQVRKQLGFEGKGVILTLARLIKRKGIDQAIRAIARLRREGLLPPEWIHVIAGRGEEEEPLRRLATELGVREFTRFDGFVPDELVPRYFGAADIFLQPNREVEGDTEGFGIVFLEANACGTPVIGGTAGGTADAIREGVTGFRVDAENVPAIGEALRRLVDDEGLRRRMGLAGMEIVDREHRIEQAVAKFEEYVLEVVRRKSRPVRYGTDAFSP